MKKSAIYIGIVVMFTALALATSGYIWRQYRQRPDVRCKSAIALLNHKDFYVLKRAQGELVAMSNYCIPGLESMVKTNTNTLAVALGWECLSLINHHKSVRNLEQALTNYLYSDVVILKYLAPEYYGRCSRDELFRLRQALMIKMTLLQSAEDRVLITNTLEVIQKYLNLIRQP